MNFIMIENDTGAPVVLPKHTRLSSIIDTEINRLFFTPESNAKLAATGQKKSKKQLMLNRLLPAIAAWRVHNAMIAELPTTSEAGCGRLQVPGIAYGRLPQTNNETHLPNLVTIYGDKVAVPAIDDVVDVFDSLRQDRGIHAKVCEAKQMETPLVIKQEEMYRSDQAKVYLVGHRDKEVIDMTFDKPYRQGRIEWTNQVASVGLRVSGSHDPGEIACELACNLIGMPCGRKIAAQRRIRLSYLNT